MGIGDFNKPWKQGVAADLQAGCYLRGHGLIYHTSRVAHEDHIEIRVLIFNRVTPMSLKHSETVFYIDDPTMTGSQLARLGRARVKP